MSGKLTSVKLQAKFRNLVTDTDIYIVEFYIFCSFYFYCGSCINVGWKVQVLNLARIDRPWGVLQLYW